MSIYLVQLVLLAPHEEQPGVWIGEQVADAPDVDAVVYRKRDSVCRAGKSVTCEIVDTVGYDLVGAAIGQKPK
jgi:hypothetical protein